MFTGIIEATGYISQMELTEAACRLTINSENLDFSDLSIGDSIAVSGICLTVTGLGNKSFEADISNETLQCTNLGKLAKDSIVNLEKSLKADSRLGGHIVSGHVDGLAVLKTRETDGDSLCFWFSAPESLSAYIAKKGSVCIDGVSLTVNEVRNDEFSVNIIPHTASETTIANFKTGQEVNLEVDLLSRYLERLLQKSGKTLHIENEDKQSGLSLELLKSSGFIK